jgi:F-type H+-transporting ATPase subunit delta
MSAITGRYARALFQTGVSEGSGREATYGDLLEGFAKTISASEETQRLLLTPISSKRTKREFLSSVFDRDDDRRFLNFLVALVDKDRLCLLDGICLDYRRLELAATRTVEATIETAFPLDQATVDAIIERFRIITGARTIAATVRIMPELLGGIRVRIGSRIYDGTTRSELDRMHDTIRN